ncbi:MAG: NAD(P)H-dependent oxidoreductase [Pseudomonadota bacterium]
MQRIVILDGDPRGPGFPLDNALARLVTESLAKGDLCQRLRLSQLTIHQCVGCFDCWLKTPGRCRLRDDGSKLVAAIASASTLVFASPMRMGFTAALLKRATDRLIPIALPYIEVVNGECHHRTRYGHGIDVALMVERSDASAEELDATELIYRRLARNMRGRFLWFRAIESQGQERGASDALDTA